MKRRKRSKGKSVPSASSGSARPRRQPLLGRLWAPIPIERLEALRLLVPLCILAFLGERMLHTPEWLTAAGFQVPALGREDYRQPLALDPLPEGLAWGVSASLLASGLALAAGFRVRPSGLLFALLLGYVTLHDRLAAFTVNKLGTVLVLALALSPAGARYGVDAWLRRRRSPEVDVPTHVAAGPVRFFQAALLGLYAASGLCKAKGDWLVHPHLLYTHLHDSYQTWVSYLAALYVPQTLWALAQALVLVFECLAPLWFAWKKTRFSALAFGLAMHAGIGLMFGPVIWFSCLMASLLLAGFAPINWLRAPLSRLSA
jgi:hypothetical protein